MSGRAAPGQGAWEGLLAAGLLVAGLACGLTWATGQLAGLLNAGVWLDVPAGALPGVVARLPEHWGDPAQAWPVGVRDLLPGPVGMYAAGVLVLLLAGGLGALLVRAWAWLASPSAPAGRREGWARVWQLRPLLARHGGGRVLVGRRAQGLLRPALAVEPCHSLLVFGPPGSGKTSRLVAPTVAAWPGPVVATSVKPDLLEWTCQARAPRGLVWVVDPLGVTGRPPARWSPLAGCLTWQGAVQTARDIAEVGSRPERDSEYWALLAGKLLSCVLFAAAGSGRDMGDVLRWLDTQDQAEVQAVLEELGEPEAVAAWQASCAREDRVRSSVVATAETLLEVWWDPRVRAVCGTSEGKSEIDPAVLLAGANSLYLVAPASAQRRLRPLFACLVGQVVRAAQEQAAARPGGLLDPRLLLALDEAGNVAPIRELPELATTARGQGIQLVSVFHDLAQLQARYGQGALTVLNAHRARLWLAGGADPGTLGLAERLAGDHTGRRVSVTRTPGGGHSYSWQETAEPLLPAASLRRVRPGRGVLVYGHLPPVLVRLPRPAGWRGWAR